MSSRKKQVEEVVPVSTPDENGRIPAGAILYHLRKHQDGIKKDTEARVGLHKQLLVASFPKWGTEEEEEGAGKKKDGQ